MQERFGLFFQQISTRREAECFGVEHGVTASGRHAERQIPRMTCVLLISCAINTLPGGLSLWIKINSSRRTDSGNSY
jgi:hypothetical protein